MRSANAITNYYTDIIDSYIPCFDGKIYDSTIVVFTRCDQLLSENEPEVDYKKKKKHGTKQYLKENEISYYSKE